MDLCTFTLHPTFPSQLEEYMGYNILGGAYGKLKRPMYDVNATDGYISGIARSIAGDYASLYGTFRTIQVTVNGTASDHFVGCDRIHLENLGVDWWVVVSLDEETIFGKVRAEQALLQRNIQIEKDAVVSDIDHSRFVLKFIVAGVAVALVMVSIVTSYIILRPIKQMQTKMESVANMDLELDTKETSCLHELKHMQRDFGKMVANLLEFRAYVPSAVLVSSGFSGEGGKAVVEPPTGNVAIVFTDIKGSTALWKRSAGDMNDAMEIHNEVLRDACAETEGYEVKTIGDSFMVSFAKPGPAAAFALKVQEDLSVRKWPPGLELPAGGLVIRIGINYGATIAEENPVTGRVDYRGSTVNLASRVEAKAKGGTICITSDMYAAIKQNQDVLSGAHVMKHGVHEIKGLGAGHELFLMVNNNQKCRLNDKASDCNMTLQSKVHRVQPVCSSPKENKGNSNSNNTVTTMNSFRRIQNQQGKTRTALQVVRGAVTVAVCRLVCTHHFLLTSGWPQHLIGVQTLSTTILFVEQN